MSKIVITSGPTRQYLDPVRYLTNASSGRMGAALAMVAIQQGYSVTVVTGPVQVKYPETATVISVVTTAEMLEAAREAFRSADGLIGAAAPCDYRPTHVYGQKMSKTGEDVLLRLVETEDIVASLAREKRENQWVVGFALETEDRRFRAIAKMQRKSCDMMISNGPTAMDAIDNDVEILDRDGKVLANVQGSKEFVASSIMDWIGRKLLTNKVGVERYA